MQVIWLRRSGDWIEQRPLLFALGLSVAVHVVLLLFAGTLFGIALLRDPELLKQIAQSPEKIIELTAQRLESRTLPVQTQPPPEQQMPMLFIEVDPSLSAPEAPIKAKYYAAQNTLAANPDTKLDTDQPRIDGKQTQIVRAFDAPRSEPKPLPLQPSPPPQAKVDAQPQKNANAAQKLAKAQETSPSRLQAKQETGELERKQPPSDKKQKSTVAESQPRARPRTVAEAKMLQGDYRPPGESMQQDGGVKRFNVSSSLSASGTPLGQYDARIIDAIKTKWYSLLDESNHARDRKGQVVIEFRLYSNGSVRNVRTDQEDVGEFLTYLCQSAILSPAPYPKWPDEVRAAVGRDYRDVRFTFYYN